MLTPPKRFHERHTIRAGEKLVAHTILCTVGGTMADELVRLGPFWRRLQVSHTVEGGSSATTACEVLHYPGGVVLRDEAGDIHT